MTVRFGVSKTGLQHELQAAKIASTSDLALSRGLLAENSGKAVLLRTLAVYGGMQLEPMQKGLTARVVGVVTS